MKLKIGSYNLLGGASDTYSRLVRFVSDQNFDVLCLQEVNGWQDDDYARARKFLDQAGFNFYAYGNSNTEYKIATFSKFPIVTQTVHVAGFWHCVVEAHIKIDDMEVVVCNVHLNPWNETTREQEIGHLLPKLDLTKPTIIAGDFNSLSRKDNYPPELLGQLTARGIMKYGQVALDYRITDRFAETRFVDSAAQLGIMKPTVPTRFASDPDHEVPVRIDYILVNQPLAGFLREFAVIQTPETDAISDHYPIVLTLETQIKEPEPVAESSESVNGKVQVEAVTTQNTPLEGEIRIR